MHISQVQNNGRTSNRNRNLLFAFAERILLYTSGLNKEKNHRKNDDTNTSIQRIIEDFGGKEIDDYFDKFTIAFGKWIQDKEKIKSMEELLIEFKLYQSTAPDNEQIDYKLNVSYSSDTHSPCGCPM